MSFGPPVATLLTDRYSTVETVPSPSANGDIRVARPSPGSHLATEEWKSHDIPTEKFPSSRLLHLLEHRLDSQLSGRHSHLKVRRHVSVEVRPCQICRSVGVAWGGGFPGDVFVGMWFFSPGLPVLWGPRASAETKAAGQTLFEHEWPPNDPLASGDGLGPVFNARSCVACHFQGGVGGGGPNSRNVTVLRCPPDANTRRPRRPHPPLRGERPSSRNARRGRGPRRSYPVGRLPRSVTGSINSTALFGAGWIDRISDQGDHAQPDEPALAQRRQGVPARLRQRPGRPGARPARRPHRQVRLEGAVRDAARSSSPPPAPTSWGWAPRCMEQAQAAVAAPAIPRPSPTSTASSSRRWSRSSTRCRGRSRCCRRGRRSAAGAARSCSARSAAPSATCPTWAA